MRIADDIKDDIKVAKKIWLPWWAVLCIIIGSLPLYWLFDRFGDLNIALPVLNTVMVFAFAIYVKRKLTSRAWFWIAMIILAGIHILLIFYIPWTGKWVPALVIAGIDSVDLVIIFVILDFIAKLMDSPE